MLLVPGLPQHGLFCFEPTHVVSQVQKVRTNIHLDYGLSFTYDKPVSVPDETESHPPSPPVPLPSTLTKHAS